MTSAHTIFDQPTAWKRNLGTAAGLILGLVLLVAAWAKAIDPEAFTEQIRLEGLDFFGLAALVAYAALGIEIALGSALVLGIRRHWVLVPTLLLVLFFLFLTGRAWWRLEQGLIGAGESCGCFGNLLSRTPREAFWQDLFLLGVPVIVAFVGRTGRRSQLPSRRLGIVAVITAAGLWLAVLAPELPLDDWATRLKAGVEVGDLCAGKPTSPERLCLDALIPELDRGRHWVVLSGLEEESFLAAVPHLNEMAVTERTVGLWIVTAAAPETVSTFAWTRAPAFEVREAPEAMLRPLHRRLPRSFLVEEGRVIETRAGLPRESF